MGRLVQPPPPLRSPRPDPARRVRRELTTVRKAQASRPRLKPNSLHETRIPLPPVGAGLGVAAVRFACGFACVTTPTPLETGRASGGGWSRTTAATPTGPGREREHTGIGKRKRKEGVICTERRSVLDSLEEERPASTQRQGQPPGHREGPRAAGLRRGAVRARTGPARGSDRAQLSDRTRLARPLGRRRLGPLREARGRATAVRMAHEPRQPIAGRRFRTGSPTTASSRTSRRSPTSACCSNTDYASAAGNANAHWPATCAAAGSPNAPSRRRPPHRVARRDRGRAHPEEPQPPQERSSPTSASTTTASSTSPQPPPLRDARRARRREPARKHRRSPLPARHSGCVWLPHGRLISRPSQSCGGATPRAYAPRNGRQAAQGRLPSLRS